MSPRPIAIAFCLLFCVCAEPARAQSNPAPAAPMGPKETLKSWNFEEMTVAEALLCYQAATDDEKKLATSLATQAVSTSRLSKAARAKWGHDAEAVISHLCFTDTHEDDDAAVVTLRGDHATLKFDVPEMLPLFLVQTDSIWRVDVAAYVRGLGAQLQTAINYCDRASKVCDQMAADITAGKYSTAQDAIDALKKAFALLETEQ